MELLLHHAWPGNVREVDNVVQHAVLMADGPKVLLRDLPPTLEGPLRLPGPGAAAPRAGEAGLVVEATGFLTLDEVERRHIMDTLQRCQGNQSLAAGDIPQHALAQDEGTGPGRWRAGRR
jgi:two-component system nitrogen regulation response regulator GlnG/two-component system response regulator HydG